MTVILKKLEKDECPGFFRRQNIQKVYQVTSDDGEIYHLDSEEEAAALVARLHTKDQRERGKAQ